MDAGKIASQEQSKYRVSEAKIVCSNSTASALAAMGRTEDIRISPDNRMLAIVGYTNGCISLFQIEISANGGDTQMKLLSCTNLVADGLQLPHGVEFIDERQIAVGNRDGHVLFFQLPEDWHTVETLNLQPTVVIRQRAPFHRLKKPGSIALARRTDHSSTILVANNSADCVSAHTVFSMFGMRFSVNRSKIVRGIDLPDGLAISPDQKLIAVSNHNTHDVVLYPNTSGTGPKTQPVATLSGLDCPHGLRFSPDGDHLIVANAGAPYVSIFSKKNGQWHDADRPDFDIETVNEDEFQRGRYNPQEGGPKGLDIDKTGTFMVMTNEHVPLRAYQLASILEAGDAA